MELTMDMYRLHTMHTSSPIGDDAIEVWARYMLIEERRTRGVGVAPGLPREMLANSCGAPLPPPSAAGVMFKSKVELMPTSARCTCG